MAYFIENRSAKFYVVLINIFLIVLLFQVLVGLTDISEQVDDKIDLPVVFHYDKGLLVNKFSIQREILDEVFD